MKIRRYLGNNTQEVLLKLKMDLGNDAVILNTRKVYKKGLMRFLAKPQVEVLAAVDEEARKQRDIPKKEAKIAVEAEPDTNQTILKEKEDKINELENKVSNVENLLKKVYQQLQSGERPSKEPDDARNKAPGKVLDTLQSNLIKNEVETDLAKKISDIIIGKAGADPSVNDCASLMYNIISGMLGKPEPIKLNENRPTVVIFAGPTGVGKTTTLAKIAANYTLNHRKNVGMITADTYRIAAVEQLKTYAEILGTPVSVIYSPTEIKEAIENHSDKDVILIDTAGRSYKNKQQFDELKTLVQAAGADEVYLVLSATTSNKNLKELIQSYNFLKEFKLLFTKLDETSSLGVILNARYLAQKSLSYVTTGQCVPDDIEIANTEAITKNLLGSLT